MLCLDRGFKPTPPPKKKVILSGKMSAVSPSYQIISSPEVIVSIIHPQIRKWNIQFLFSCEKFVRLRSWVVVNLLNAA